jgi:pyridoxal-phosphate dependent TrpB-like enzyme
MQFDMPIEVYQVKVSYEQKPYRKAFIENCGGAIFPSPSDRTQTGNKILAEDPSNPGSLGIAISEAIEACITSEAGEAKYALGSVLSHVLMHQTVIGLEAIDQLKIAGEYPDVVVGCTGGGSNFGGIAFPFMGQKFRGESEKATRFVAVEPAACPSLTKGVYCYDFGDTAMMTPLIKAHTLGSSFMPPSVHAGGLRYHAMAPLISHLVELGALDARAVQQRAAFDAGHSFMKAEGILPAPEATHAIEGALVEALAAKEAGALHSTRAPQLISAGGGGAGAGAGAGAAAAGAAGAAGAVATILCQCTIHPASHSTHHRIIVVGESRTILFNMCGHGHFDMAAWEKYTAGEIEDFEFPQEAVDEALKKVPGMNGVDFPMPN